jgi:hypothetical protein
MMGLACIRHDVSNVLFSLPLSSSGFWLGTFFDPEDKDMFL